MPLKVQELAVKALMAQAQIPSKAALARRLCVYPQELNHVLQGHRRISGGMLEKLCAALGAQPGQILVYEPDLPADKPTPVAPP